MSIKATNSVPRAAMVFWEAPGLKDKLLCSSLHTIYLHANASLQTEKAVYEGDIKIIGDLYKTRITGALSTLVLSGLALIYTAAHHKTKTPTLKGLTLLSGCGLAISFLAECYFLYAKRRDQANVAQNISLLRLARLKSNLDEVIAALKNPNTDEEKAQLELARDFLKKNHNLYS